MDDNILVKNVFPNLPIPNFSFGMNYVVPVGKLSLVNVCCQRNAFCNINSIPPKSPGTDDPFTLFFQIGNTNL